MAFYAGILFAGLFAWLAFKVGFYQIWTALFNILIAVYLAIHLSPVISEMVPAAGSTEICRTLCMFGTALGIFLIMHGISYVFLLGQFNITFPKILDTVGASFLGFLAGFLVWSFVTLLICTGPISDNAVVKTVGLDSQSFKEAKMESYLLWWGNLFDTAVAPYDEPNNTEKAIADLLEAADKKTTRARRTKSKQTDAQSIAEPNHAEESPTTEIPAEIAP